MKKSILIIVTILFCQNALSQTYTFDRFIQYNSDSVRRTIYMFNSKNTSYYFYGLSYNQEMTGSVYDLKNNIIHRYSVANIQNAVKFEYLDSSIETERKVECYDKNNLIEMVKTPLDSVNTNFSVLKFKNSKKKKIIQSSTINAIKSEIPVFSLMMEDFFYHFTYCQKINFPENYLPTFVEIDYYNGNKSREKLIQNKEVNVVLSVNKKM